MAEARTKRRGENGKPSDWWICTEPIAQGGAKVLGPFINRDLVLRVRTYVEQVENRTYWVDGEERRGA